MAIEEGVQVALAQGIVRRRKTVPKLSCGSNSGFGVLWKEGKETAAVGCLADLARRTRPAVFEVFSEVPLAVPRFTWEKAFTFWIDLRKPLETIVDLMKREARKKIRRAERLGVSAMVVEDQPTVKQAYDLIHETAGSKRFPVPPKEYSLALHRQFATLGHQGCAVALLDGKIVAAAALLGYGRKVAWWKGGSSPEGYKTSAGNLLQLAAIEWSKKSGFEIYDLGGTDPIRSAYARIHEFKSSLGGDLVEMSQGSHSSATARLARRVARSLR
jgi:lipid II:glycine glycyltransferase (peptidoglycan interpeptide bridge formation enzyme)